MGSTGLLLVDLKRDFSHDERLRTSPEPLKVQQRACGQCIQQRMSSNSPSAVP